MTTASIVPERRRSAVPIAAALVSGVLLWAASPAVGLGWLAWVAIVPAAAVGGRLALPLAYGISLELLLVSALPFGLAEDQWADDPVVPIMVGDSPVLAVALVAVPLVTLLLYALRFPFFGTSGILAGAVGWTALDVIRTKLDPGGLWGPLFLTQHDTVAADVAAVGGPWLLTFAIVAVNLALARGRRRGAAAVVLAAALVTGSALAVPGPERGTRVVAAVQPGYDTAQYELPLLRNHREKRYEAAAQDLIGDLAPLTREAARRGADLVVWPEAVLWVDPREIAIVRRSLERLARETRAAIVVPYFLPGPAHGAALVVGADGTLSRPEPKHRPMWFVGEHGGNRTGDPRPVGELGLMLGVDNQDPGIARALAAAGADVLVVSEHDWEELAPQQRAFSRLASVALGRPLVRADWRYGSAIFDRGELRGEADASRTVVVAAVGPPATTPYTRIGDLLAWAALVLTLLASAGSRLRGRGRGRRRRAGSAA
jgi:apolipoprotein N-acyltransferase